MSQLLNLHNKELQKICELHKTSVKCQNLLQLWDEELTS